MKHTISALQGHPYLYNGRKVIALEYGEQPVVLFVCPDKPSNWTTLKVSAFDLTAEPLRYFHGQTPQ